MPTPDDPLMLWCSSHTTLGAEEIPLFLEAGFRVVPLLTNYWTKRFDPELDKTLCQDWRASASLPDETIHRLQALSICTGDGLQPFSAADLDLLSKHVHAVYVTVHPHVAIRLAKAFPRSVIYRAFGHGGLTTYSEICLLSNVRLDDADRRANFIWCPILSSLQEPEDDRLCRNPQHLRAFVTPNRLGSLRWEPEASDPYVVETIPRIEAQDYYRKIYDRYVADHGHLRLKILGDNVPGGGPLGDDRIVGKLAGTDYYAAVARARVSIYHGTSPYHLHYHPIEFMTLGVPVLFHRDSAFAAEARCIGHDDAALSEAGMYADAAEANGMAEAALGDAEFAARLADRQRFFMERIFSRTAALEQAVWLRTLVTQRAKKVRYGGPSVKDVAPRWRLGRSVRRFIQRSRRG